MKSNLQNNKELEIHEQIILQFFKDCKAKKLLCNNAEKPEILRKANTRADISILVDHAVEKIREYRNIQKDSQEKVLLTEKEHDALQFYRIVNFLRENIEELKIEFGLIFDSSKIKPNTELGKYLDQIFDKLEYDYKKKVEMNAVFQKYFRNALSHQDYWYNHNETNIESITWQDKGNETVWGLEQLCDSLFKIINLRKIIKNMLNDN